MKATWTDVDGVPALCAAAGEVQGPLHGALMFAVGRTDETLPVAGVTHLVEHLTLHDLGRVPFVYNGSVEATVTTFWAEGGPEQVVEFLGHVAKSLGELPLERLDDERRILEIEASRGGGGSVAVDLAERFGPHGPGVLGWPEYGLNGLTAERVDEWARSRFVAENAVLWFSGPVPPGLDLGALSRGPRPEPADIPSILTSARTLVALDTPRVSLSCLSGRWKGVGTGMLLAQQRAQERLRAGALSYAVGYTPVRIAPHHTLAHLEADAADESHVAVARALSEVVEELADTGPDAEEFERFWTIRRQFDAHPQQRMVDLEASALQRVLTGDAVVPDDLDGRLAAQTPESVRDAMREAMDTALLLGPPALADEIPGWRLQEPWSTDFLRGTEFVPIPGRERGVLTVGDDGITWRLDGDHWRAIRWDDVEALLALDSGTRLVVGTTGLQITVSPWCWQGGEVLTGLLDDAIGAERVASVGAGSLHYSDDDERVDVRWLATIAEARHNRHQHDYVSLVVDTDGVFVIYGNTPDDTRAADRDALLASDPRNRWIPQGDITRVDLKIRPWTPVGMRTWTLTIETNDDAKLRIYFTNDQQWSVAMNQFPRLLGARFTRP